MKKITLIFSFIFTIAIVSAQDIHRLKLTYEYESDDPTITAQAAEMMAFEEAKLQALEEHYGVDMEHLSAEVNSERNLNAESKYFSFTQMAPRGEWIETVEERVVNKEFRNNFWHITVYVEGKARAKSHADIDLKIRFANSLKETRPRKQFFDGDDLFLHFTAPMDGYLCVYLTDESGNVFCLLPYENGSTGSQPIQGSKDYMFFSTEHDQNATELILRREHPNEHNMLYVVFSPNDFAKALDSDSGKNKYDEQMPRMLSYIEFLKWMSKNQKRDNMMTVRKTLITIN